MAGRQTGWDSSGHVVPDAAPYQGPGVAPAPAPVPPSATELFVQRLVAAGLMLVLASVTAALWGVPGAFRILFTAYTLWAGYWLWALFVRRPRI